MPNCAQHEDEIKELIRQREALANALEKAVSFAETAFDCIGRREAVDWPGVKRKFEDLRGDLRAVGRKG